MCGIVCTIQDITSSLYDLKPPCLYHHTNYIWHCAHCICVIASTVLMVSDKLYFWDHICYNSRHRIPCIRHDSNCMPSQSLHSWHQIPYIWLHLQGLWRLIPYMWHDSHYVCEHMSTTFNIKHRVLRQYNRYMWNHNLHICICVITQTVSLI